MNVHFSSEKHDWATPWPLFRELDARFGPCELDVGATERNAKCGKFFSPEDDGLSQVWHGVCWMNPPYGRALPHWMHKAVTEVREERARRVVCLLPSRTDTRWWHQYVLCHATEIHYLRGRIRFEGADSSAPFPSVVAVFDSRACGAEALFSPTGENAPLPGKKFLTVSPVRSSRYK